jgi:hypothetical protein
MMDFKQLITGYTSKISNVIPQKLTSRTSSILRWTAIGIAIRFLLMPILAGPDFMTTLWISFTLVKNNQLIFSNDPPAIFFLLSGFYNLMLAFFPSGFFNFITSGTTVTPPSFQLFALLQPGINTVLFISKIPFLLFDVLSAFLILHLFSDETKAFTAFKIWLINPVVLVVSYVHGQFDIVPVFFIILALYFLKKKRFGWTMLTIGFGGVFKIISLALLPLIAISAWKALEGETQKTRLFKISRILVLGLLPLLSIPAILISVTQYYESVNFVLPLGSMFNGFFGKTFYTRGIIGQPFYSGLLTFLLDFSISLRTQSLIPDFIYFIPFVYTLLLLGAIYERKLPFEEVCKYFTVFLLAYYAFSLFHSQWFLWIQPFLILLVVENRRIYGKLFALLMPLYFLYTLQWDAALTARLLTPMIPQALFWPGPITVMNNIGLPAFQIISLFRTVFSAICVSIIFYIVKTSFWVRERKESELDGDLQMSRS